jgi:hypothetical protein
VAVANFSLVKVLITPTKVSLRLFLPRERSVSFSFTLQNKKNPPEQSLVNRRMQNRLYVVVSEPFLETAAMGISFFSQWKKHYFCRGIQDRPFFQKYWQPPTCSERETVFVSFLHLGLVYIFYFFYPASQSQQCANILKV